METLITLLGILIIVMFVGLCVYGLVHLYNVNNDIQWNFEFYRKHIEIVKTQKELDEIEGDLIYMKSKLFTNSQADKLQDLRSDLIDKKNKLMDNGIYK